jgi:quercetin dioxygenase-like cupin family protein
MIALEQKRRSFLLGLGSIGISRLLAQDVPPAQAAAPQGYVLEPTEGEHLVHFRDHGSIYIKVGSATGSDGLALGTQQVMLGAGIPIHRHLRMDEAFYVLEGSGVLTLNDVPHTLEKGGTIFIARNTWHGFSNCRCGQDSRKLANPVEQFPEDGMLLPRCIVWTVRP